VTTRKLFTVNRVSWRNKSVSHITWRSSQWINKPGWKRSGFI